MKLQVKLLTKTATLPRRADAGSVGYDLNSDLGGDAGLARVYPGERRMISTGIATAIPSGHYGRVAPRSGLALKMGIDVLAGVIDPSYRGDIAVILFNTSSETFVIQHGDRIAQLILERCSTPDLIQVETLDDTARGEGGFGSTGVAA